MYVIFTPQAKPASPELLLSLNISPAEFTWSKLHIHRFYFPCHKLWSLHFFSPHLSLNREGRRDTTGDFTTSFLHFSLFSTALWDLANSRPVYSLMSSSHLFLCLLCLLPPSTVPCNMVLARPHERETCPYHCTAVQVSLRWSGGLCAV